MSAPMTNRGRVLVVDDDRLVLITLVHGLTQAGFEVVQADNGDDAILLAREHRPQLALLDIRMQGLSGFDVAQYLRDYCHTPFAFVSAFSDAQTRAKAQELGAVDCLSKPVDMDRLVQLIDSVVAQSPHAVAVMQASTNAAVEWNEVALATGVLMHRHSWDRLRAYQRLQALALQRQVEVQAVAAELVRAQESLAAAGAF